MLLQEAHNRNLDQSPEIQRRLKLLNDFLELDNDQTVAEIDSELKQSDLVIRRYLISAAEKMLLSDHKNLGIDPASIKLYYENNSEEFRQPEAIAFQHIYFKGVEQRTSAQALTALKGLKKTSEISHLGAPFIHGINIPLSNKQQLRQLFGAEFSQVVFLQPDKQWSGPFQSDYGFHLVKITHRKAASTTPLPEVFRNIEQRLLKEKQQFILAEQVNQLKNDYVISIATSPLKADTPDQNDREGIL